MDYYFFIGYSATLSFIDRLPADGPKNLDYALPLLIAWPREKSPFDSMLELIESHYSENHPNFNFISGRLIAL